MNPEDETEKQYVLVEIGSKANEENNLLPSPVAMSTGEANYVNDFLKSDPSSTQRYQIIEDNVS
jgi:hypothetical protein